MAVGVLAVPPEEDPGVAVDATEVAEGAGVAVFDGGVLVGALVGVSVGLVTPGQVKLALFDVFRLFSIRIVFAFDGTFAVLKLNDTGLVVPIGNVWLAPLTGRKSPLDGT